MATVKIFLEPTETEADAVESLVKALTAHEEGETHEESFAQPAAQDVLARLELAHSDMWAGLLRDINAVLDEELT